MAHHHFQQRSWEAPRKKTFLAPLLQARVIDQLEAVILV
jgi:hypothetical protein